MKVLFLYTELAGYFLKCCEELSRSWEVHIVRWPLNSEAPFDFHFPAGIRVYEKKDYSLKQLEALAQQIGPDMIVCSGWVDRDYLRIARKYAGKIPTVITSDTHWKGSLKQYAAMVLSRLLLVPFFSHAWVPGAQQKQYMQKLGFSAARIRQGFYCCDLDRFNRLYEEHRPHKEASFPKRFLFVGRYYEFKGLKDLWDAFLMTKKDETHDWELWCVGTGSLEPARHPSIRHFGFVQPEDLGPLLKETGVFVLPSREEPWGVVVQEYAAAGFPLILSDAVGAAEALLSENGNGFTFRSGDSRALAEVLKKTMKLSVKELHLMALKSHQMAQQINPAQWADTVTQIYNDFRKQ